MTSATRTRRTVAGMEERLARATELIRKMMDDNQAEYERYRDAGRYEHGSYAHGAAGGLNQALSMLEWAFSPEQDWMFQRGKR